MFCLRCGNEIPDESRFCFRCGTSVEIRHTGGAQPAAAAPPPPAALGAAQTPAKKVSPIVWLIVGIMYL